jgi:hypothetical protein
MRLQFATLVAFGCTLASSACKLVPGPCTTNAAPAVSVAVHDSASNALVGRGAKIIARDGAFADTADITNEYDGPYGLAHERTGSYDVTVEQQGYRVWSRAGLNVTRGECHVQTVSITARLQP